VSTRGKILLLSFFGVCVLAGFGVYQWHESALDDLAVEDLPYSGPLLSVIDEYLTAVPPDRVGAEARLTGMPDWDRDRIVAVLAARGDKDSRLLAIAVARRFRDRPIPRIVLAKLVLKDPDAKVKEAAKKALNGEPP
jgi:ribosomal protein S18 acetylase RimI-like enzyme